MITKTISVVNEVKSILALGTFSVGLSQVTEFVNVVAGLFTSVGSALAAILAVIIAYRKLKNMKDDDKE